MVAQRTAKHLGDREQQFVHLDRLQYPYAASLEAAYRLVSGTELRGVLRLLNQYSKVLRLEPVLH